MLKDAYFLFFTICVTSQIFISCYYANNLEKESQGLTTAIYSCNWMDQNKLFRKTQISFMQRSQIPINIRAANWLNVNLSGFLNVSKSIMLNYRVILQTIFCYIFYYR